MRRGRSDDGSCSDTSTVIPVGHCAAGPTLRGLAWALVPRELNATLLWLTLAAAATAVVAAYQAFGPSGAVATPLLGQLVRRFDLTLLATIVLFMVLRTASRIEADHQAGWLGPYLAAGGSRAGIGLLYSLVSLAVPLSMFAAGSVCFALAVAVVSDSMELVALLPRTLGGGLLLLLSYAGLTVAVSLALRTAVAVTTFVLVIAALPQVLILRHVMSDTGPPVWTILLSYAAPALSIPGTLVGVLHAVGYGTVMIGVAMLVAARRAGRTT